MCARLHRRRTSCASEAPNNCARARRRSHSRPAAHSAFARSPPPSSHPPPTPTSEYHGQFAIVSMHPCPLNVIPFSSTKDGHASFTKRLTPSTSYVASQPRTHLHIVSLHQRQTKHCPLLLPLIASLRTHALTHRLHTCIESLPEIAEEGSIELLETLLRASVERDVELRHWRHALDLLRELRVGHQEGRRSMSTWITITITTRGASR